MRFLSRFSAFEQFALLMLRAGSGIFLALLHGWNKITALFGHLFSGDEWRFIDTVSSLGFPIPVVFAAVVSLVEFVGGLLFAIGYYTRYVALLIAITMGVAVYRHLISDMRYELAALFLLITLYILTRGAGRYSFDRFLRQDTI
jgi:putative oxidoreductase